MPKILPSSCLRCLSSLQQRFLSNHNVSSINKTPMNDEDKPNKNCHPKNVSCHMVLSACGSRRYPECHEPHVPPRLALNCCCNRNLTKDSCEESPTKKLKHKEKERYVSMWELCGAKKYCPLQNERYDDKYYEPSDRNKRNYTQTWKNCEPLVLHRKVCCINEMCMLPPVNRRRKKEDRPETAKEIDNDELLTCDLNILKTPMEMAENPKVRPKKCKKLVMPGCRNVASLVLCVRHRRPSQCLKNCCPYPSFSECQRGSMKPKPNVECCCLRPISLCDATRSLVRKRIFNIKPPLPDCLPRARLK